jgi:hypothetical protein
VITAVTTSIALVGRASKRILTESEKGDGTAIRRADGSRWQLMAGFTAKLGRKKEGAIVALLSQRNVEEAARVADIAQRTLYRWMKEPEFDAAYREARRAAFSQSTARLQQASGAAVATLLKIMVDSNAPASTRVRAADTVLDHAARAIELEDIQARVAELERAAKISKPGLGRW